MHEPIPQKAAQPKFTKEELQENPRQKTRVNLIGRYLPCATSGYKTAGAVHGLTLIPIKRGKNSFFVRCGVCGTNTTLSPEFDPTLGHGLTYEQAVMLATQAAEDGMGGIIL